MDNILSDTDFDLYRKLIYDESGIHFSATNRAILESRLAERLREKKLQNLREYYQIIISDKDELKVLLDSVTTNLTRFFRNQGHFDALEHHVLPELMKQKKERTLKIWSAGCSTGEEPYSIAMLLEDKLPSGWTYQITASDISLKSLMVGKEGFYPEARIQGVPEPYLARFFEKLPNGFQVKDAIKTKITFDYHNLKHDSAQRNLDIVFCRNVLIYFDEPAQKATVERFWQAMADKSFLFIGHSESLFGMNTKFEFVKTDWTCLYRKWI